MGTRARPRGRQRAPGRPWWNTAIIMISAKPLKRATALRPPCTCPRGSGSAGSDGHASPSGSEWQPAATSPSRRCCGAGAGHLPLPTSMPSRGDLCALLRLGEAGKETSPTGAGRGWGCPRSPCSLSWPCAGDLWGLRSAEGAGWGWRVARQRSPSPYYILKCNNSMMSIFVDGTDHFWKKAINLKGRGNNLAKVTLRQHQC